MASRVMTAMGRELLELYPPFLRRVPLIQGVCNAVGGEVELQDAMLDELERNLTAATAEEHLGLWESQMGLTVDPPGLSVAQRQALVRGYMALMVASGSGLDWEATITLVLGTSGWSYLTNDPSNPSSPPPHVVRLYLPYAPGSMSASIAVKLVRAATPAADQIDVFYTQGFILDESLLDSDPLA
ncbi:MAG: Bacteriophage Mu-like, Gp48 [Pseudonocardiales bacterium]|jgi:hypothetical protein|nr:Bacteriophage Mu-like, Gp48 [Pseudonocardiales bacterium]